MNSKNEGEIEQVLADLATDKTPEAMPADVAARLDAHLQTLMANDRNVIQIEITNSEVIHIENFKKTWGQRITKNSSWLAAASVLTVMALVGVNSFNSDQSSILPTITNEEDSTNEGEVPTVGIEPSVAPAPVMPTSESEIPVAPIPQDGGSVYGNGEEIGRDLNQPVRKSNSGSNYGGFLGPIAEEILPLELPGSMTSLPASDQACIKSLGISGLTIGVDLGSYKGSKITAYWIATGTFERGAVLVSSGCKKITFVKE